MKIQTLVLLLIALITLQSNTSTVLAKGGGGGGGGSGGGGSGGSSSSSSSSSGGTGSGKATIGKPIVKYQPAVLLFVMLRRRNSDDGSEELIEVQSDTCPIPHCTVDGFCGTQEECDLIMKKKTDNGAWILWVLGLGFIAGIIFGIYKGC